MTLSFFLSIINLTLKQIRMKKLFPIILFAICSSISCNKTTLQTNKQAINPKTVMSEAEDLDAYLSENVCLVDFRVRTVSSAGYAAEIMLADFGDGSEGTNTIWCEDRLFTDDGTGYDQTANDGIYTSEYLFEYDTDVSYSYENEIISIMTNPVIDENFAHQDALDDYIESNAMPVGVICTWKVVNADNPYLVGIEIHCAVVRMRLSTLLDIISGLDI